MTELLAMALVLAALAALFGLARFLRALNIVSPEQSRKIVHVAMGLICLCFPWLFRSAEPVVILAVVAACALLSGRTIPALRERVGCVLYGVQRRSYGEFAFIGGIAAAFVISAGNPIVYMIPVAVLAFADTAAALVGMRYGAHRFRTLDGQKSAEGSLAFLLCGTVCTFVPLSLLGSPHAALGAALVAIVLTCVEATAWAGLDNFSIPLVGAVLLQGVLHG